MAVALTEKFLQPIHTSVTKDIEWDGETMPVMSVLFVLKDNHYEIVE